MLFREIIINDVMSISSNLSQEIEHLGRNVRSIHFASADLCFFLEHLLVIVVWNVRLRILCILNIEIIAQLRKDFLVKLNSGVGWECVEPLLKHVDACHGNGSLDLAQF